MNICLFFEGTGQGVEGHITNVTRLRDLCVEDDRQRLHLESGPGTRFGSYVGGRFAGVGWRGIFRSARRWFEANYKSRPPRPAPHPSAHRLQGPLSHTPPASGHPLYLRGGVLYSYAIILYSHSIIRILIIFRFFP